MVEQSGTGGTPGTPVPPVPGVPLDGLHDGLVEGIETCPGFRNKTHLRAALMALRDYMGRQLVHILTVAFVKQPHFPWQALARNDPFVEHYFLEDELPMMFWARSPMPHPAAAEFHLHKT